MSDYFVNGVFYKYKGNNETDINIIGEAVSNKAPTVSDKGGQTYALNSDNIEAIWPDEINFEPIANSAKYVLKKTFVVPNEATHIKVCWSSDNHDTVIANGMICTGKTLPPSYIPYGEITAKNIVNIAEKLTEHETKINNMSNSEYPMKVVLNDN
jgi:hypothetical protein